MAYQQQGYQGEQGITSAPQAPATTAPTAAEERKLAKDVNEEYHDPLDDWSSRDILLSMVPVVAVFAFKDAALRTAMAFAIGWSAFLIIMRTVAYDSRRKTIWPMIDLTNLVMFAILRGLSRSYFNPWIYRWITLIVPLVLAFVGILTLLWRRPFTAHYARYPKFDRGGRGLWHGDASYRRTADITTLGWICAWSVMLLLSLIPILTGYWFGYHALNVIFNYIIPLGLMAFALVFQQVMGSWYKSTASKASATSLPGSRGAGFPTGAGHHGGEAGGGLQTSAV